MKDFLVGCGFLGISWWFRRCCCSGFAIATCRCRWLHLMLSLQWFRRHCTIVTGGLDLGEMRIK